MRTVLKRIDVKLNYQDEIEKLELIKKNYGLRSDTDAMRLALSIAVSHPSLIQVSARKEVTE
jgi:hypothetical protein